MSNRTLRLAIRPYLFNTMDQLLLIYVKEVWSSRPKGVATRFCSMSWLPPVILTLMWNYSRVIHPHFNP